MTYNKSEIMRSAWKSVKSRYPDFSNYDAASKRRLFADALRFAWWAAKMTIRAKAESPRVQELRQRIFAHECKDRWTEADFRSPCAGHRASP